jgi:hypothetical protein
MSFAFRIYGSNRSPQFFNVAVDRAIADNTLVRVNLAHELLAAIEASPSGLATRNWSNLNSTAVISDHGRGGSPYIDLHRA